VRLRKLQAQPPSATTPLLQHVPPTVHEACLLLDRQFPWLAEAFARRKP
jgi:hypothetical protein